MIYSRNEVLETEYDKKKIVGNIFKTKNYGGILIIGVHALVGRNRRYIIEFLNNGHQQLASKSQILNGEIKNNGLPHSKVGKIYGTYKSGECIILEVYKGGKGKRQIARVKFLDTGHEQNYSVTDIERGSVFDPYAKFIYGVGYYGELCFNPKKNKEVYSRWYGIIMRVYKNGGHINYKNVSVCERWHCLKNFYEDFSSIEGYENFLNYPNIDFHIDKDIIGDKKTYSKESCIFIPQDINTLFCYEQCGNKTGYPGVSYETNRGMYNVVLSIGGKSKSLGRTSNPEEGYKLYMKRKMEYCDEVLSKYDFIGVDMKNKIKNSLKTKLNKLVV